MISSRWIIILGATPQNKGLCRCGAGCGWATARALEKEGLCHAWAPQDLRGEGSQKRGWVCSQVCMCVAVRAHVEGLSLGSPPGGY